MEGFLAQQFDEVLVRPCNVNIEKSYILLWQGLPTHLPQAKGSCPSGCLAPHNLEPLKSVQVWFSMVWYGLVWFGLALLITVRYVSMIV